MTACKLRLRAILSWSALLASVVAVPSAVAQSDIVFDSTFAALRYRCIGPFRGGRSAAVTGVPGKPLTYYFGSTGGGVWKTEDGGQRWENISDGFFGGSIGAVAVSEWDPNVIYVGGGEVTVRGNVSHGYGIWKSTDAGKNWNQVGLTDSRHVPRIRIHPKDPDVAYAAVLGHLFGPSKERGVYRTLNGGKSWERILFVNNEVGAVDLTMDPSNPRILYASTWRVKRTPHSLESGGPGSGLWKSTDAGDTWKDITRKDGLPRETIGIIGMTVSPVNPSRVWAIIEAGDGGVFRSENAGETWTKVNDERKLRQRAWYYTRIYADPASEDIVYVLNVEFWRSKDGGRTYQSINTPHVDHHDLWIAPEDSKRMIIGDDGGAQVSVNWGKDWSTYHNQPTAQFYRVSTDNSFPYRIYGAQQDNSPVRILHRSSGWTIDDRDWEPTAGGESGWLSPHPENPDVVYGGSYSGYLERYDHRTDQVRLVNVWPDNPIGHGANDWKYRFQWNFPLFFSPHNPAILYAAANVLFKTTNEGQSWTAISPDLTRNDTTRLGPSGGPITKDNTGVEYYCTIFTAVESPHETGVIWTGSDDGLIHLTRDGGKTWKNVTPPKNLMPEWIQINSIEAHPTVPGGLYVAATMYKHDDFRPYLYATTDNGTTWKKITRGIADDHFTRVIRADPERPGLLYAGTESGMYISFNDGASWKPFQLNLPIVPITDLAIKGSDLVVATQGRSFWVLDDLTVVRQLTQRSLTNPLTLFHPRGTYRMRGGRVESPRTAGENAPPGALINYMLTGKPDSSAVNLRILAADSSIIRSFSPKATERDDQMPMQKGLNRFSWDLRYPDAEEFPEMIFWGGTTAGPRARPGHYFARLISGTDSATVPFEILKDPRNDATDDDFQSQFDLLIAIRDKLTETHRAIKRIRDVREQINGWNSRLKDRAEDEQIRESGKNLLAKLTAIEEALYQTKNRSGQDPLNFPVRLNNKLASVASLAAVGDYAPTDQAVRVMNELTAEIDRQLNELREILDVDLRAFNTLLFEKRVPAVIAKEPPGDRSIGSSGN